MTKKDQTHRTHNRLLDTAKLDMNLAGVLLIGIFVILNTQIIGRQIGVTMPWAGEVARIMNVWIVFLAIGRQGVREKHIHISYFFDRIDYPLKQYVWTAVLVICVLTTAVLSVSAIVNVIDNIGRTTESANLPIPLVYTATVLGMSALALVYGKKLIETLGLEEVLSNRSPFGGSGR